MEGAYTMASDMQAPKTAGASTVTLRLPFPILFTQGKAQLLYVLCMIPVPPCHAHYCTHNNPNTIIQLVVFTVNAGNERANPQTRPLVLIPIIAGLLSRTESNLDADGIQHVLCTIYMRHMYLYCAASHNNLAGYYAVQVGDVPLSFIYNGQMYSTAQPERK